ncbi:MAG: 2-amino-4-hydroxy-6-hydroxymethyldihydropteridine diphosphokinase [Solirubrobacterales bacterium]
MTRAFLGLGSNVGDRLAQLREAAARVAALEGVRLLGCSSVYETEPVGEMPDQRDFFNAAVCVDTELEPLDLLAACKAIERDMGRAAGARHGPRTIDVDVLLVGDRVLQSDRLTLPHPELHSRRFVLLPLLELDPDLALPGGGSLRMALDALPPGQRADRVGELS